MEDAKVYRVVASMHGREVELFDCYTEESAQRCADRLSRQHPTAVRAMTCARAAAKGEVA